MNPFMIVNGESIRLQKNYKHKGPWIAYCVKQDKFKTNLEDIQKYTEP